MQNICEYFIEQNKPQTFNIRIHNNIIVKHEKSFQNIITSLQESGIKTENLTVFEFYSRIEHFEIKYQKLKSHGNNKQI